LSCSSSAAVAFRRASSFAGFDVGLLLYPFLYRGDLPAQLFQLAR
jgi:hypothetical protein